MVKKTGSVLWFSEFDNDDIALVGQRAVQYGQLTRAGFTTPPGFVISAHAYFQFLKQNNLTAKIKHMLATVNYDRPESLLQASSYIRRYIRTGELDPDLISDILAAYQHLGGILHHATVDITASEISGHAFRPGELEHNMSYHDITGESNIFLKLKELWASLFEAHAIFRRHRNDISHFTTGMAIIVQKTIPAESSGTLFTSDPVTGNRSHLIIEARHGLTPNDRNDPPTPDHYTVSKSDLLILKKAVSIQSQMIHRTGTKTVRLKLTDQKSSMQKITDKQIDKLSELGKKLEKHSFFPQQAAWAIEKGKIYILHTKQLIINPIEKNSQFATLNAQLFTTGTPASPGIATGRVKILVSPKDNHAFLPHDILVTTKTNEALIPAIKKAAAVITEQGGLTSHAAFLSRSLGVPAIVGVKNATTLLKQNQVITVNGTAGTISHGTLAGIMKDTSKESPTNLATKLYASIKQPGDANAPALHHADGIGILYPEAFLKELGMHPKKLLQEGKRSDLINTIAGQIAPILKTVSPRPVLYKLSDFTSSHYLQMTAGKQFEHVEPNPILGYHGAFRYIHDPALFNVELEVIKTLRNKHNLKNISVLIPYIRSTRELTEVKRMIAISGLHRSPSFKCAIQIQIPANVFSLASFVESGIDGIDIDTDILTALLLGTDNNNEEVIHAYDPLHPGVLSVYEQLIKQAQKHNLTVTISGRALAKHPLMVEKAVSWGVTGITVQPEALEATRETIAHTEKKILTRV